MDKKGCLLIYVVLIVIPVGIAIWIITYLASMAAKQVADPEGYEQYLINHYGVVGEIDYPVGPPSPYPYEDDQGRRQEIDSTIEPFHIKYWNGKQVLFYADAEVWEAVVDAHNLLSFCDPRLNIAVAFSESTHYTNFQKENAATALGTWQFIRSTWDRLKIQIRQLFPDIAELFPNAERTNREAAAVYACVYFKLIRLSDTKDYVRFIARFWGWNHHFAQADFVWRLYQELQIRVPDFKSPEAPHAGPTVTIKNTWWNRFKFSLLDTFYLWPESLMAYDPSVPPIDSPAPGDQWIAAPYKGRYSTTGGLHGQWYGHCAVDLSKGKGAEVTSPINGVVKQVYRDFLKNTVVEIENKSSTSILMHLIPDVKKGQQVVIGQRVGTESNQGNTWSVDRNGRRIYCGAKSNCGYHTHWSLSIKGEDCVDPTTRINYPPNRRGSH